MANASGAPTMATELVSFDVMTTGIGQSSKEPLIQKHEKVVSKKQPEQNPEEEDPEDQLTLSHLFMNKAGPSLLSVTPVDSVTPPSSKRPKLTIKESRPKKSVAYSSPVMEKAKALQASLDPTHPSFVKFLTRSHVTQGFWMGLPMDFYKIYLPNHDQTIKLEGDNGVQYETKFLAGRGGLSGGWRGFSLAHNLQEGDAVVFHLVRQYEFKVYIMRKNNLDHHAHEKQLEIAVKDVNTCQQENKLLELALAAVCFEENCEMDCSSPKSDINNFSIQVNGCILDSEIPDLARVKYYELCRARKSCLHVGLLKNINNMLAVGIILGTVSIADEIQDCNLSTFQINLKKWDRILKAFKGFGMEVDFLQERIRQLSRVANQEYSSTFQHIAKSPW